MEFKITKLGDRFFLVTAMVGSIPKTSSTFAGELVRQLKREFQIGPSSVRLFWPEEDRATSIIALLSL